MIITLRNWTLAGVAVLAAAGCSAPSDQDRAAVASTQAALSAQPEPAADAEGGGETSSDARRKTVEQLRESIAKLDQLEATVREVPNTQDAVRQLRTQKQRLGQRIREVERNAQALQE